MAAGGQQGGVLATWQTSSRVTAFLIESLPDDVRPVAMGEARARSQG